MQIETCQVGRTLRLGDNTRIVIRRREGERICVDVTAPAGTDLILGGASVRPTSGTIGVWTYFFSLQALRRFMLGRFEVEIWLPGELVPHAADCDDWLHIGITPACHIPLAPWSAPVTPAVPLLQVEDDGGRLLLGGA
ncbi:MAG: hypothetical protein ACOY82_04575 [Pseudomonadota bacterium]